MGITTTGRLSEKALRDCRYIKKAIENGDQKAYADLMQLYWDKVYRRMLNKTGNPVEAEDLTIDTFGKAFLNLRYYSSEYAFSTWLYTIANNKCIDFLRRKKDGQTPLVMTGVNDINSILPELHDDCANPEQMLIIREKVLMLRQVVERLKPQYRDLIELRYYQEYSITEIAAMLNLPEGTVKVKLLRAREFLYNLLKLVDGKV